eukprot:7402411-Pyramimonas_sp.AAC.1
MDSDGCGRVSDVAQAHLVAHPAAPASSNAKATIPKHPTMVPKRVTPISRQLQADATTSAWTSS